MKYVKTMVRCLVIACLLSGITQAAEPENELVIRVATDATCPPMAMLDNNRHIVGFDIDVMNAIAREAGFQVIIENTAREDMLAGLAADRYDAVIGALVIEGPGKNDLDYSDPYLGSYGIAVKKGNTSLLNRINQGIRAVKAKGMDRKFEARWLNP